MNKCGKRNYDIHNFTHNFWMGCRRYSDGCKNCHMWLMQSERGVDPARIYRCKYQTAYGDVLKLQRQAEAAGEVYTVTACSYSDFFIEEADAWRDDSWAVMKQTPNLVWQLVTKRPENIAYRLPADWGTGYRNVWLGVTVESRKYLTRLDTLSRIPCVLRWLNLMPTLEELMPELADHIDGFHWVIQSGEVGCDLVQPRPFDYQWARNIRDLCAKRGIAFAFLHGSGDGWGREPLDGVEHRAVPALLDEYRAKMAKAPRIFDRAKLGNCRIPPNTALPILTGGGEACYLNPAFTIEPDTIVKRAARHAGNYTKTDLAQTHPKQAGTLASLSSSHWRAGPLDCSGQTHEGGEYLP